LPTKAVKRSLTVLLVVVLILAAVITSIRLRSVQTWLVNHVLAGIEQKYEGKVSVDKVLIRWPHRIELTHVLILDPLNDTLLFTELASFTANKLDLDEKRLQLGRVIVESPVIQLRQLPSGKMNYELFLEALKSVDSTSSSKPLSLEIGQIVLRKGTVQYKMFGSLEKPGLVNWNDILIKNLELSVKHFAMKGSEVKGGIELLSFADKSGFAINNFTGGVEVDSLGIHAERLALLTGNSRIESAKANATGLWKRNGHQDELNLDIVLGQGTSLSPVDLTLLTGINTGLTTPLEISGVFTGSPANARLLNASFNLQDLISFSGDLVYNYPGQLKNAFFDLETRSLVLNVINLKRDLLSGQIPGFELVVPEILQNLQTIEYDGVFTGTFENFITTGNWLIAGNGFATNLRVNKNWPVQGYNFKGSVSATGFNPDSLFRKSTNLSSVSFKMDVDGVWDGKEDVTALLVGGFSEFTLNGYPFQNLSVNGRATGRKFEGSLDLRDSNANFDLDGSFDFSGTKPVFDFDLLISHADLFALNLIKEDTLSKIHAEVHGSFTGDAVDNVNGEMSISNSVYTGSRGTLPVNNLVIASVEEMGHRRISLSSDYIDARVVGNIHLDNMASQVQSLLARFVPTMTKTEDAMPGHLNDFVFNIQLKNPLPVTRILLPGFQFKDNSRVSGFYKAADQTILIEGLSPQFVVGGRQFTGFEARIQSSRDSLILNGGVAMVQVDRNNTFEHVELGASLSENWMNAHLTWDSDLKAGSHGKISCKGSMSQTENGYVRGTLDFPLSEIVYSDSIWRIEPFRIVADRSRFAIEQLNISHNSELISLNGAMSENPSDTLAVMCNQLNLNILNKLTGAKKLTFGGRLTGVAQLYKMQKKGMFLTDARIDSLSVNGQSMGLATISSRNGGDGEPVLMDVLIRRGAIKTLQLQGQYDPVTSGLRFNIGIDKLRMDILNPFVKDELLDVKGLATGNVLVRGTLKEPILSGNVMLQKASFIVNQLNTRFYLSHNVVITPDAFSLVNADLQDEEGNHATVSGAVRHKDFRNISLDLDVNFRNFLVLNEIESRNRGYWGRGYASGVASIKGPLPSLVIDVSARTNQKSKFYVPVNTTDEAQNIDFITYKERSKEELDADLLDFSEKRSMEYKVNLFGATVNIDMEVTPDAEVKLIFDSKVGDVIQAQGSGNLRVYIPPTSGFTLTGDYTIEKGEYQFTLQNMPVKKLEIEPGATLKWTGDATNTQLDIDAVYRTKASLYDLLQDETNTELTQRLPVECHLLMSGYLENPNLDFSIVLPPNTNDIARTQLQNLTKEELHKQIFSLLILNRFMPLQGTSSGTTKGYESAGISTTTEVLSNQLNYWLSQISKDFDVGFNYRPGDQLTSDEVEVALTKQFLNNRIIVNLNGNYDVRPTTDNTNQLVGDVDVEFKIKPSGKVRVKVFTRANDHLLYEYAPYTQGVGLFYREEFDSFGDLRRKYREKLFGK